MDGNMSIHGFGQIDLSHIIPAMAQETSHGQPGLLGGVAGSKAGIQS